MDILNFAFRLLKHGSIFLLKLVGIGLGAASAVTARSYSQDEEKTPWEEYCDYVHGEGERPANSPYL